MTNPVQGFQRAPQPREGETLATAEALGPRLRAVAVGRAGEGLALDALARAAST